MEITIKLTDGPTIKARLPYADAEYITGAGDEPCPFCEGKLAIVSKTSPGRVYAVTPRDSLLQALADFPDGKSLPLTGLPGHFRMPHPVQGHDRYTGAVECTLCRQVVGRATVKVSTVFGIEEDRAVLHGRCRVY